MKRTALIILALVVLVLLTACQKKVATYTITMQDGTPYTVNTSAKTVFDGMYTYAYEFYGNSENYTLTLTYPDSSTYSYRMQAGVLVGYGAAFDGASGYAEPDILKEALSQAAPSKRTPERTAIIIVLILAGAITLAAPRFAWFIGYGWRFKDSEPGESTLIINRIGGAIAIIAGIAMIIFK